MNPRFSGGFLRFTRVCRVVTPSKSDLTNRAVDRFADGQRSLGAGQVGVALRGGNRRVARDFLNVRGGDAMTN